MKMEDGEKQNESWCLASTFHILSIVLLNLLIPLSFLLLSRLSVSNYYLARTAEPITTDVSSPSFIHIIHHDVSLTILYIITVSVSTITVIHSLSGKIDCSVFQSHLYVCWVVLFAFQASLLVTEGDVSKDIYYRPFLSGQERWIFIRVLFFLGLHEVMLMWFRVIVKPVVDDTMFRAYKEERWPERAAVAAAFGVMWWWKLRNEAEGLAAVAEAKQKLLIGLDGLDFVNWWMYYLCVVVGMARVLRGFFWALKMLMVKRTTKGSESCLVDDGDNV